MKKVTFMGIIICHTLLMIDLASAKIGTFYANDQISILSEPIFKSPKVVEIDIGTELTAYEQKGSWYYVTTKTGNAGWVSDTWVSDSKPVLNGGAELTSHQKESKIKELEAKVKPIPAYKVDENLDLYKQLLELDPTNSKFKNKVAHYSALKRNKGSQSSGLIVGQKYVTIQSSNSVFTQNKVGLFMYLNSMEDGILDYIEKKVLSDEGVITPIKSGIIVLVTAVEKNVEFDALENGKKYTVYTVHPEGTGDYFKTFGKGLKPF